LVLSNAGSLDLDRETLPTVRDRLFLISKKKKIIAGFGWQNVSRQKGSQQTSKETRRRRDFSGPHAELDSGLTACVRIPNPQK